MTYDVKSEDVYEDFSMDKGIFDFSNYSPNSKYYDNESKLVHGKMKDETTDVFIKEFVRLNSKIYSIFVENSSEHKKQRV